jgi:polar amino acid transport system substrate-binding protein
MVSALKSLDASGDYKRILTTWGVQSGAISSFALNP